MQKLLVSLSLFLWLSSSAFAATQTQARLVLSADTARPGETILAGVQLRMAKGWHTYWRYGGDAGAPTQIKWKLPEGVTAGEIQWPVPEKLEQGGLFTYIYHGEVVLLVPLTIAASVPAGSLSLQAKVSWLECEELCVPGDATVEAALKIGSEAKPSEQAELIHRFQKRLAQTKPDLKVSAKWLLKEGPETNTLSLQWKATTAAARADFYPYGSDAIEVVNTTKFPDKAGPELTVAKGVTRLQAEWPKAITGLLIESDADDKTLAAYEVEVPLPNSGKGAAPAAGTSGSTGTPSSTGAAPATVAADKTSLAAMLGLAFLGGLILNIMPCVLPVIALKVLGFVNQSQEQPARVRKLGLVYGLGVIVSFLVLAGLVIAVQQAGKLASWGMQFQNPVFLVLITLLVLLVALNLFGVFEVTLGSSVMGGASSLASREGYTGAFFNGVLATALATPCTAPFLSVALGFAFTQPAFIIALMFSVVGLGLAVPYVLLCWFPALMRFLPKPGTWMVKFKVAMGFPMLATAIWLFSILTRHYGTAGVLWVGLFLVCVALAAWVYGQFIQTHAARRALAWIACLLLLAGGYGYALESQLHWRKPPANVQTDAVADEPDGIRWQRWSAEAVAQARQAGHPVLVDFTADWCLTCKANKTTSLEIKSVRDKLSQIKAVALLADYTRGDDAITQELRHYGRAGVPLVLVYPANPAAPPQVLPTVLTPGVVLEALDKAAQELRAEK
jgi:thiol:disulfide interchange protein DsbD